MTRIPFFAHALGEAEVAAFAEALRDPILTTGNAVAELERGFAAALPDPPAINERARKAPLPRSDCEK